MCPAILFSAVTTLAVRDADPARVLLNRKVVYEWRLAITTHEVKCIFPSGERSCRRDLVNVVRLLGAN